MQAMPVLDVMSLRLVRVAPDDAVREAIARMLEAEVGSVAVCDGTRLVGIFTERDVLRLAGEGERMEERKVGDVMTTRLVTISPDDDIIAAARLMGERKVRHLPVVQGDNVLGMIGIRDVVAVLAERLWRMHDEEARETVRELLARGH
jgi:CBS domain-containing protein